MRDPVLVSETAASPERVVLLVDDEADILESFQAYIEWAVPGVEVRTAVSGDAGLEVLRHERVDLVLSDYRMPRMDGLEFLRLARQVQGEVPSVMFSAFPDPALRERARVEAGCVRFTPKSIGPRELARLVGELLALPAQ